jgi:BirA family biotin operon repressor/biotin-[acetyl-CoA-carboxylase] ligase
MIGCKVYSLDVVDSTNEFAKVLIGTAPEGTVVWARQQTHGRGRFGKAWHSPEQGLWMSVVLRPANPALTTIAAGVAVCEALRMCDVSPSIKWPNDILLNTKKVGGILTEIVDHHVIVGIGLNLNIQSFPDELTDIASSVYLETKQRIDREHMLKCVCSQLERCYTMLTEDQVDALLSLWRSHAVFLGHDVIIEQGDRIMTCTARDISETGALIVTLSDGRQERVVGGTCRLLPG